MVVINLGNLVLDQKVLQVKDHTLGRRIRGSPRNHHLLLNNNPSSNHNNPSSPNNHPRINKDLVRGHPRIQLPRLQAHLPLALTPV